MAAAQDADTRRKYSVQPWFQVIFILSTCFSLFFILYTPITTFTTSDSYPELISITPQKVMQFGGEPAPVEVGLYIRDFPEFNMKKGFFVVDVTVWLRFNPRIISLDRVGDFSFEMAKTVYKSDPTTHIVGKDLMARYNMRLKFNTHLDYNDFPFDDHRLSFTLVHRGLSPSDIIFQSSRSNLLVSPDVKFVGWNFVDKHVKAGYGEERFNEHSEREVAYRPRTVFSLDYQRSGVRSIISIFVPLLLIFFLSLLTFSFNPFGSNASAIIAISTTSITAMIGYRFVIETMSPPSGDFMLSDSVFLLFLLCSCSVLFINIMSKKFNCVFKSTVIVLLHTTVIATLFYLVAHLR